MIGMALGAVLDGIEGKIVQVEADVVSGFPQFSIVGLPDSAVSESKLRIRSAIRNAGLSFPNGRITVNLSPASMRKHGAGLDLAIAIAILRAAGQLPQENTPIAFCAELSLSGTLIPVREALNLTLTYLKAGITRVVVSSSQPDVFMVPKEGVWLCGPDLFSVCRSLRHEHPFLQPNSCKPEAQADTDYDISEVEGLNMEKRAMLIAAAGCHHTMLIGPPGSGKTMLAERFISILPDLAQKEKLEVYAISNAYQTNHTAYHRPPVRIPHHSVTVAGLIGGGNPLRPGEVSFAHHGILILDELLEFTRNALESLREPLEQREVYVSRARGTVRFPANFTLIATSNPCPCGKRGFGECICTDFSVKRYFGKLSGPLLDRMDIVVKIEPNNRKETKQNSTLSKDLRKQVESARMQIRSQPKTGLHLHRMLTDDAKSLLDSVGITLGLSRRGVESMLRVAHTITALEGKNSIMRSHIEEAAFLRNSFISR